MKLSDFFPRWILIHLTWNLQCFVPNSVEILTWNFRKKLFCENFSEIFFKPRLSSTKLVKFRPTFGNFFWVRIAMKKFTQVLSYVVLTKVRRHVDKQITKRKYGAKKPGRFVFVKQVLFTLGLGLTTPYCLGILVWNFYETLVTMSIEFSIRSEPQIRPTRFTIKFLCVIARAERKVHFSMKLFDFFF